jgi:hypothetical protein
MPSQGGDESGSVKSGPVGVGKMASGGGGCSGPVTESKGLRSMIASPDLRSGAGSVKRLGGVAAIGVPEVAGAPIAEPISCVTPAAWK